METVNEAIDFNGAQITAEMAEMIRDFQDDGNLSANLLLESIGDFMINLIQDSFGETNDFKAQVIDQLSVLATIWDTVKSLKKQN
jgi:hypothetical protein